MLGQTNAKIVTGGSQQQGEYFVKVLDYDGTIIDEQWLDDGDEYTLPASHNRTEDGLLFQEWSCSQDIVDGKVTINKSDVMIGAIYTTSSGQSEFDIELNSITGLSVTLNLDGTKDWGDGSATDTLNSHTYSQAGKYTIKCNGTTISGTFGNNMFGGNSSSPNKTVKCAKIVFANLTAYSLAYCHSLENVVISKTVTKLYSDALKKNPRLKNCIIPSSITTLGYNGGSIFEENRTMTDLVISKSINDIYGYIASGCSSLKNIVIPENANIRDNSERQFYGCNFLERVFFKGTISSSISTNSMFYNCYNLKIVDFSTSEQIGYSYFSSCINLKKIIFSPNLSIIGSGAFTECYSVKEYDFSNCIAIPTLANSAVFSNISPFCKIKVPASLYDQWITETNWSTYANYIVAV